MSKHAAATFVACSALALSAAACSSDDSGPAMLRDGIILQFEDGAGVHITTSEAECLDKHFSDALGIDYPATWEAYRAAMDARLATAVSAFEATGVVTPDPLGAEASKACLGSDRAAQLFAVGLIAPIKWSDLSTSERQCVLAETAQYEGSIRDEGIETGLLERACGL